MDLQLTEEQGMLAQAVAELLDRADATAVWGKLVEFGAFEIGEEGLGAVELALVSRAIGARLVAAPYADAAAVHYALGLGDSAVVACLSEPGRPYLPAEPATALAHGRVSGDKDGVPHAAAAELFAVPSASDDGPVVAIVAAGAATIDAPPTLDSDVAPARVSFDAAEAQTVTGDATAIERIGAAAATLVSAEAVGAAAALLDLACEYAGQRRQFGQPIAGFQAVRHILADMYVQLESAWSSVLYAAASLDEGDAAAANTASITKVYAARATRDVAHGALQVFGGIAFTAEHPAHRFLRRIVVRGGNYGTVRDHELAVAASLAGSKR